MNITHGFKGSVPREHWPQILRDFPCRGVHVGECVTGKPLRHAAHAHTHTDPIGHICFRSSNQFHDYSTVVHELAHVITRQGHTRRWFECLKRLPGSESAVEWASKRYKQFRSEIRT